MTRRSAIGSARRKFWDDYGFLVFPGFFSDEEVDAVQAAWDHAWEVRPPWVIVDNLVTNRRARISDITETESEHNFKVNDLYLFEPAVRNVALSERIGLILEELLGDEPTICNSLNLDKGSQQINHLDTLYMTPVSTVGLVATWVALEDAHEDSGPLRYYPASNHIEPYRFSTGSMHQYDPEVPQWADYMATQVDKLALEEQRFIGRRGDLFIWHALLFHGGSEIRDLTRSRRSMVTHYWTQTDCEATEDLRPAPGGWWRKRGPAVVPGETEPTPVPESAFRMEDPRPAWGNAADVDWGPYKARRDAERAATKAVSDVEAGLAGDPVR